MYASSKMYYKIATPKGLYIVYDKESIHLNIDNINDILAIYDDYVLTTTGLYKIKDNYAFVEITKLDIQNVKKISARYQNLLVLTNDNKVLLYSKGNTKKLSDDAVDICFPLILHSDNTYTK